MVQYVLSLLLTLYIGVGFTVLKYSGCKGFMFVMFMVLFGCYFVQPVRSKFVKANL